MLKIVNDIRDSRDLVTNLTLRELRGKYRRSVLGWTWSLLNPLASMAIYAVVFGVFLKVEPSIGDPSGLKNFPAFLMCALLPWSFLAASINGSMEALLGNAGIIRKVYFPRQILVFATVFALVTTFLLELLVLGAFLIVLGNMVFVWVPMVLVLVAILTMFCIGIGLIVSIVNVYFRDVKYLMTIFLQFWFYATPIVYPLSPTIPETWQVFGLELPLRSLYSLNPAVGFVECFRNVLYDLRFPDLVPFAYISVWSIGLLLVGIMVFRRFEGRLAEEL